MSEKRDAEARDGWMDGRAGSRAHGSNRARCLPRGASFHFIHRCFLRRRDLARADGRGRGMARNVGRTGRARRANLVGAVHLVLELVHGAGRPRQGGVALWPCGSPRTSLKKGVPTIQRAGIGAQKMHSKKIQSVDQSPAAVPLITPRRAGYTVGRHREAVPPPRVTTCTSPRGSIATVARTVATPRSIAKKGKKKHKR